MSLKSAVSKSLESKECMNLAIRLRKISAAHSPDHKHVETVRIRFEIWKFLIFFEMVHMLAIVMIFWILVIGIRPFLFFISRNRHSTSSPRSASRTPLPSSTSLRRWFFGIGDRLYLKWPNKFQHSIWNFPTFIQKLAIDRLIQIRHPNN